MLLEHLPAVVEVDCSRRRPYSAGKEQAVALITMLAIMQQTHALIVMWQQRNGLMHVRRKGHRPVSAGAARGYCTMILPTIPASK